MSQKAKDFTEEDWIKCLPGSFTFEDIRQTAEAAELDISELPVERIEYIGEKFMELVCNVNCNWTESLRQSLENLIKDAIETHEQQEAEDKGGDDH